MVLRTDQFVISASLNKTLRKVQRSMASDRRWQVRFEFAFEQVMREFAAPRSDDDGTWIAEDIVVGYRALHRLGYAHSSEVWLDRKLVGGAYGVSIGQMFYGESMFTRVSDASKIALAYLVHFLRQHGVTMEHDKTSVFARFDAYANRISGVNYQCLTQGKLPASTMSAELKYSEWT